MSDDYRTAALQLLRSYFYVLDLDAEEQKRKHQEQHQREHEQEESQKQSRHEYTYSSSPHGANSYPVMHLLPTAPPELIKAAFHCFSKTLPSRPRRCIVQEAKDPKTIAEKTQPLAEHGEVGNGRSRVDNINSKAEGGTSSSYLTARIARDNPSVLEAMKAGEYPSVRAAAKAAGILKEGSAILPVQRAVEPRAPPPPLPWPAASRRR